MSNSLYHDQAQHFVGPDLGQNCLQKVNYCKFEYFHETSHSHVQSFMKIKPSPNGEITLPFTDVGKSCTRCEFSTSQTCLLTLFAKIKFSLKFLNLQYEQLSPEQLCSHQVLCMQADVAPSWVKVFRTTVNLVLVRTLE